MEPGHVLLSPLTAGGWVAADPRLDCFSAVLDVAPCPAQAATSLWGLVWGRGWTGWVGWVGYCWKVGVIVVGQSRLLRCCCWRARQLSRWRRSSQHYPLGSHPQALGLLSPFAALWLVSGKERAWALI